MCESLFVPLWKFISDFTVYIHIFMYKFCKCFVYLGTSHEDTFLWSNFFSWLKIFNAFVIYGIAVSTKKFLVWPPSIFIWANLTGSLLHGQKEKRYIGQSSIKKLLYSSLKSWVMFFLSIRNIVLLLLVLFFTIMWYGARVDKKDMDTGQQVGFFNGCLLLYVILPCMAIFIFVCMYLVMKMNQQSGERICFGILLLLAYIIAFLRYNTKTA